MTSIVIGRYSVLVLIVYDAVTYVVNGIVVSSWLVSLLFLI